MPHLGWACDDFALDEDDRFRSQSRREFHRFQRCEARIEGDLNETSTVPQIDEYQLAEVALPVYPSSEVHLGPRIRGAKCAAGMTAKCGRKCRR